MRYHLKGMYRDSSQPNHGSWASTTATHRVTKLMLDLLVRAVIMKVAHGGNNETH